MKTLALQAHEDAVLPNENWMAPSRGEADFCSREGAAALKSKIEGYWRERGQEVFLSLHNVGFHPAIRAARFDVRSDMVNGMPRQAGAAGAKRASFDAPASEPDPTEDEDFELEDEFA